MKNQENRERIEKITVVVEYQHRDVIAKRSLILKEIAKILKESGNEKLIKQLDQVQYFIDDAMYLAIYQAALVELTEDKVEIIELPVVS